MMQPVRRLLIFILLPALLLGPASLALGGGPATDALTPSAIGDNDKALREAMKSGASVTVIVQLEDNPIATYAGGIRGIAATKPAKGKKLDRRAPNALGYARYLEEKRGAFKAYLRSAAASARVEAEYDTVVNGVALTLSGRDLQAVLSGRGVKSVSIDRDFRPAMNLSRGLIGGTAFNFAFPGITGEGMKVGIIDSGIQASHPFFDPEDYSLLPGFPIADNSSNQSCTTKKIIVARAYPKPPGPDACADNNGHGTHVAGTVAGNAGTSATIGIVTIDGLSGVAHRARLGNYNVFPNDQASARSVEIIRAIEDAVGDGMDVLNMSLGGPVHQPQQGDPLAQAVNAAAEAGVVVAVAAGNAGPGFYTVSSPGNASGALTAAASTNPHFLGIPVTWAGLAEPLAAVLGQFGDFIPAVSGRPLANYNNAAAGAAPGASTQACSAATVSHTGQIVVIDRGVCTFSTKIRNAQLAGAIAVLMVNNSPGDPVAMAQDGTPDQPTIDGAMVRQINRLTLRTAAAAGTTVTVDGTAAAYSGTTPNADIIAGFSSVGPVAFDNRFKPDVTAPGVNVLSSTVDPDTPVFDWAFFQGTSMATPHIAGAAALLKQLHPDWTPEQIKSALVTRAKRPVVGASVLARGGGRIDLNTAKDVNLTFTPANFSFGWIQPKNKVQSVSRTVTFTNTSGGPLTWSASIPTSCALAGPPVAPIAAFAFSGSATGSLAAGASASFTVVATSVPNGPQAFCAGDVTVTATGSVGTQTHRVPWLLSHLENVNSPPP